MTSLTFTSSYSDTINDIRYKIQVFNEVTEAAEKEKKDVSLIEIAESNSFSLFLGLSGSKDGMVARIISYLPVVPFSGYVDFSNAYEILKQLSSNNWHLVERRVEKDVETSTTDQPALKIIKKITLLELSTAQKVKIIATMVGLIVRAIIATFGLGFLFIIPDLIFDAAYNSPYYTKKENELWAPILEQKV